MEMIDIKRHILLFFIFNTIIFSFQIDKLKFDEKIFFGESKFKKYKITNNTSNTNIYELKVEGDNFVHISPSRIELTPTSEKYFTISVIANKKKGTHNYFLVISEKRKNLIKNIGINKIIKIKHTYTVI